MSREENVFGLPVTVHANRDELLENIADHDQKIVYAVRRCVEAPDEVTPKPLRERRRRTRCDSCGEMCFYDPVYILPGVTIRCLQCLPEDVDINADAKQVAEVRSWWNL